MVYKIDSDGATIANEFTDGNPSLGIKATQVEDTWLNMVQGELVNVVEGAGLTLNKLDNTQLAQALSLISTQNSQTDVRCASELRWDGSKVYFSDNIEIVYRSGAGARRVLRLTPASAPVPGEITIADGSVVVVAKDNASASPVTLTYQSVYANLAAGQWAVVPASSLTATNIDIEMLLFGRVDVTPTNHYGAAQKTLTVFPIGDKFYDESVFTLGSSENKLLQGIYSQAALNANFEVSQLGNFTTAVNSTGGFSNNAFLVDGWKIGTASTSVYVTNGTFQRTSVTITGEPHINKAGKIVLNTSGVGITGNLFYGHVLANNSDLQAELEKFKGKTWTFEFWLRSNKASNVRVYIEDGVNTTYQEISTGSGDQTWRRYSYTHAVSASATAMKCWIAVCDATGSTVAISNNEYIEVTGGRIHIGSERLGVKVLSYMDDLNECRSRIIGAQNGELMFNAGYSCYNINTVALATWSTAAFFRYGFDVRGQNTDCGTEGIAQIPIPDAMIGTDTRNIYIFDQGATTRGGTGANARISVLSAAGVTTDNITPSGIVLRGSVLSINNTTVITEGMVFGYGFILSDIN